MSKDGCQSDIKAISINGVWLQGQPPEVIFAMLETTIQDVTG